MHELLSCFTYICLKEMLNKLGSEKLNVFVFYAAIKFLESFVTSGYLNDVKRRSPQRKPAIRLLVFTSRRQTKKQLLIL